MAVRKVKNGIVAYFHCGRCAEERPDGQSPQEFQRIEAGWTKKGLQIWCVRHNCNLIHLNFRDWRLPALAAVYCERGE
jgi:hypothetical protein